MLLRKREKLFGAWLYRELVYKIKVLNYQEKLVVDPLYFGFIHFDVFQTTKSSRRPTRCIFQFSLSLSQFWCNFAVLTLADQISFVLKKLKLKIKKIKKRRRRRRREISCVVLVQERLLTEQKMKSQVHNSLYVILSKDQPSDSLESRACTIESDNQPNIILDYGIGSAY